MLGQMIRLKVCVFCSFFAREGVLLFDASLLCADVADDKDHDDEKDAQIVALKKQLAAMKVKKVKKVRVSKWKVEHAKVVADVESVLATIKTFDCNRLFWLAQHMTQQKRKCLDLDSTVQASLLCYTKWICQTRNAGKLSRDVSSDKVGEEESEEESEEEEDDDDEEVEEDGDD